MDTQSLKSTLFFMYKLFTLCSLVLATSCTSKSVTEADLNGKSFVAEYDLSSVKSEDPQAQAMVQMAAAMKRTYTFEQGGKGSMKAGEMITAPIKWAIQGDSLSVSVEMMGQSSRQAYAISSESPGFKLEAKDHTVQLKPI